MLIKLKKLIKYRNIMLIFLDMGCIAIAYLLGTLLITGNAEEFLGEYYVKRTAIIVLVSIFVYQIIFHIFGVYKHIIRYEGSKDYATYMALSILSSGLIAVARTVYFHQLVSARLIILASIFIRNLDGTI